jgi:intracellular septation protein
MMQLLEWAPLVAFFAAYKLFDIYWATGALMVACTLLMLVHRARTGKFKTMHVVTVILALLLGGATILLHDKRFIQWKLTVLFGLTSLTFLGSTFIGEQPLARRMLESAFPEPLEVSAKAWRTLNYLWAGFFALVAAVNLYVAWNFSENFWVNFKFYGVPGTMMLFMLPQAFWLSNKIKPAAADPS